MDRYPGIAAFYAFMLERHNIYERKKSGQPYPWTDDEILKKYKFCNVFRELDTGTVWCREHIREPFANDPELFFNIAAYRSINCLETWAEVYDMEQHWTGVPFISDYNSGRTNLAMKSRRKRGERIFTNAHMLTGVGSVDKIDMYTDMCWKHLWEHRRELEPQVGDTLHKAFERLIAGKIPAVGKFIAYEIITDLRHTRYLNSAYDIYTWANPGNGAVRGAERVMGCYVHGMVRNWERGFICDYMKALLDVSRDYLPGEFPKLEMRDIEHTLCEFDKYERARLGQGAPRMHYVPKKG